MRVCEVVEDGEPCPRPHAARGWCNTHCERWRRHGDPLGARRPTVGCSVVEDGEPCPGPHVARGMCGRHHRRWLRKGDPRAEDRRVYAGSPRAYFDARTRPDGDCLVWVGYIDPDGYGGFTFGGTRGGRQRGRAHRLAWELAHGPIPEGLVIRHRCPEGRRDCVAIAHLAIGTYADNSADMAADGTRLRGERIAASKLTRSDVRAIRADPRGPGEVAALYGIGPGHVRAIRNRRTWAWLDDEEVA